MSRTKIGEKVTFAIPPDLLAWADKLGAQLGMSRHEMLRSAIAQGLLVAQLQREALADPQRYNKELSTLLNPDATSEEKQRAGDQLGDNLVDDISRDHVPA